MKVVLVTGAAKRLGRAIALRLADAGWDIAIHYRSSRADAETLAEAIQLKGRRAALISGDLGNESEVQTLIPRALTALGSVSALINSASVFEDDRISSATRGSWDRHIDTNLRAPLVLSQSLANHLPETERGVIVNIIDQVVLSLTPQFLSYTVSKAALWTLTQTMAQALAPRIRVNAVAPGPSLKAAQQSQEDFDRQVRSTLLQRASVPADIAEAVHYLVAAGTVTGQMIAVDSGQHLGWQKCDFIE